MKKAFEKNQKVTYIADFDGKGTVYFIDAIVHSCGNKQMVLINEATGAVMGRHFLPEVGSLVTVNLEQGARMAGGTFPRMTEEEADKAGLKIASSIQSWKREGLNSCLMNNINEAYKTAIRKELSELHELSVIKL